jgi:hypothetical protein
MKKLIVIAALLPFAALSQVNIDTIYVRNLTMQAQDWLWLTGRTSFRSDSIVLKGFRKIRARAQEVAPIALTANVNIDSIPGKLIIDFYRITKTAPAGEIVNRYTAITNAISAKTVLAAFLAAIDVSTAADFVRWRELGKYDLIDQ